MNRPNQLKTDLQIKLIIQEVNIRLEDADRLYNSYGPLDSRSDSYYLLKLLAFELLLKCTMLATCGKVLKGHKYCDIFHRLPESTRSDIIAIAQERVFPSKLNDDPVAVLKELGKNFVSLRYPFSEYENIGVEEYIKLGQDWARQGMPENRAKFRYYPRELFGLTYAIQKVLSGHIPEAKWYDNYNAEANQT